jgi:D-proline reductase (dithiol) PrdB
VPVDSFKFLPRIIAAFYQTTKIDDLGPVPWTPLAKPLSACKVSLVTTGGIYHQPTQKPFDTEREKQEPTWGDPSFRALPSTITQNQVGFSHLHLNPEPILEDVNVLLPVDRIRTLAEKGVVGQLAETVYSFMGFQGFPPDTSAWKSESGPEVARRKRSTAYCSPRLDRTAPLTRPCWRAHSKHSDCQLCWSP